MHKNNKNDLEQIKNVLPFPEKWIRTEPQKVEKIISKMTVVEQARCIMQAKGRHKQDLLLLSPKASEVAKVLAPEEIYHMIKEVGEKDCLPVLSVISLTQLQYILDLEWWFDDKFLPERVRDWMILLESCNDPKVLHWLLGEDFDQVVAVLQSLIKVYKNDELTDSYEGIENLQNFSPDGIYDIFFKVPEVASVLSKFLKILLDEHPEHFFKVMEAVIWYPVSPTIEKAYHWRLARTSERGIPEFEEAFEIYSRLNPEVFKVKTTSSESFPGEDQNQLPPNYPVAEVKPDSFFSNCLALLHNESRLEAIRWELVYLGNKVMVADRRDPADPRSHSETMQKVLGTVNIGLELAGGDNTDQGVKLLEKTWMQPLFQVGYGHLVNLKWQAGKLAQKYGRFLDQLLNDNERDYFSSLITNIYPMVENYSRQEEKESRKQFFESLKETLNVEKFFRRLKFYVRFSKQCLNLTELKLEKILETCQYPERPEDVNLITLSATAFARHSLFNEISCNPLPQIAAQTFLELIFLPQAIKGEPKKCKDELIKLFQLRLKNLPMAWIDEDKQFLEGLIDQCTQNLENQFGSIDFKSGIDWRFTAGLCIQRI